MPRALFVGGSHDGAVIDVPTIDGPVTFTDKDMRAEGPVYEPGTCVLLGHVLPIFHLQGVVPTDSQVLAAALQRGVRSMLGVTVT